MRAGQEQVNRQQRRPDADRGIGDVKDGPVVIPVIDLDEIDYPAHAHSIYEIAADAAGQQCERYIKRGVGARASHQIKNDYDYGADRNGDQQPLHIAVIQHAESDSAIFGIAEVQQTSDYRDVAIGLQGRRYPVLGRLVHDDDSRGDQEVPELNRAQRILAKFIRQLYLPPILLRFAGYIWNPA